jgi:hypothetical protein
VTDERTLIELIGTLHAATTRAAAAIVAREKDGSFLERTLRDELAARLPGARTEQSLDLDPRLWPGRLGGVDILYVADGGTRVGIETKVWDVCDSLYDVLKLAAGTQSEFLAAGVGVVAGRSRDWRVDSAVRDMSDTGTGGSVEWDVAGLLLSDERHWAKLWSRSSIRPTETPARIRTYAREPVAMPRVPDHEIRLIGVQAVGGARVLLDDSGRPRGTASADSSR